MGIFERMVFVPCWRTGIGEEKKKVLVLKAHCSCLGNAAYLPVAPIYRSASWSGWLSLGISISKIRNSGSLKNFRNMLKTHFF